MDSSICTCSSTQANLFWSAMSVSDDRLMWRDRGYFDRIICVVFGDSTRLDKSIEEDALDCADVGLANI